MDGFSSFTQSSPMARFPHADSLFAFTYFSADFLDKSEFFENTTISYDFISLLKMVYTQKEMVAPGPGSKIIEKGELVAVIRTPKGIYIKLSDGTIFAVRNKRDAASVGEHGFTLHVCMYIRVSKV